MEIDECQSNPCKNNGTCIDLIGSFNCNCTAGFNGTQCENNIDDCPSHGCFNGTCVDGINSFTCDCNPGFNGTSCEININECEGMFTEQPQVIRAIILLVRNSPSQLETFLPYEDKKTELRPCPYYAGKSAY